MEDDSNYMFRPIAAIIRYSSESMVVVLYTIVVVMSRWWDLIICDICYCKEMWGGGGVGFRDEARGLQQAVASPWLHQKCPWCFFPWPQYSASTIMRLRFGLSLDIGRFLPVGKTVGLWIHLWAVNSPPSGSEVLPLSPLHDFSTWTARTWPFRPKIFMRSLVFQLIFWTVTTFLGQT